MKINHNILKFGMVLRMVAFPLLALLHSNSMVEPTISAAMLTAQSENRQLLLFFTSRSCDKCRDIETYLKDEERFNRDDKRFVAAVVDLDDFDGKACGEIYDVDDSPTFIIVRQDGSVRYRAAGKNIAIKELQQAIDDNNFSNTKQSGIPEQTGIDKKNIGGNTIQSPDGEYSLQLGFFSGRDNAMNLMKKAEGAGYRDVTINTEMRNEKAHYRVLVGAFPSEDVAEENMKRLQADGFDARIYQSRP